MILSSLRFNMISSHRIFIIFILIASIAFHFVGIWHPREAVFDEVHFGKFVSGYLTRQYFFDIHPPLGKLMIAGMGKFTGFTPGFDFETIGEQYPNYQYIWLRVLPAFFGSLLAPLMYLLALRMTRSVWAARIAAIFTLFENALLVQSKFILMDSFLLIFGFLSLYFFLQSKTFFREGRWGLWSIFLAAILSGLAMSVKWTGASFEGLILIFGFAMICRKLTLLIRMRRVRRSEVSNIHTQLQTESTREIYSALIGYAALLILPVIIYISFFFIHFSMLPKPGPGNAFMSARFNQSQHAGFPVRDFFPNIVELNKEMFRANQRITATHSYSSRWYTWPFMTRPIYYWNRDVHSNDTTGYQKIYFLGNPFVWWVSTCAVLWFFITRIMTVVCYVLSAIRATLTYKAKKESGVGFTDAYVGIGYAVNFFPFIFIGRIMFLYHYMIALLFAILITAILVDRKIKQKKVLLTLLIGGTITAFIIIAPVTYGTTVTTAWPTKIFWLKNWI